MADVPDRAASVRVNAEDVARIDSLIDLIERGATAVISDIRRELTFLPVRAGAKARATTVAGLSNEVRFSAAGCADQRLPQRVPLPRTERGELVGVPYGAGIAILGLFHNRPLCGQAKEVGA